MTQPAEPAPTNPEGKGVDLDAVLAELDPLGKALFDGAFLRVQVRMLQQELADLRAGSAGSST